MAESSSWISVKSWPFAVAFCLLVALAALGDTAPSNWAKGVSPEIRGIVLIVTALGNSSYMFAGSALVAAIAWWGCRSTQNVRVRAKLFRVLDSALFLFVVIATSGLAAQVIKHIIGRARPKVGPSAFSFDPLSVDNGFASLPSGHATSAFRGRHSPRADGRSGSRGAGRSRGGRRCFSGGLAGALSERRRHRCGTRGDGRFGVSRAPRSSATI